MTDDELRDYLLKVRALALSVYPFSPDQKIGDPNLPLVVGMIAGLASAAVEGRRFLLPEGDEPLTEAERRRLLGLAIAAVPKERGDAELTAIIAKLSGTDTVLIARRAYPAARR